MRSIFLLTSLLLISCSNQATFRILEKPIRFDQERVELSLEYMKIRNGMDAEYANIVPKMVVVHWTAIPTIESSFDVFNPSRLRG